MAGEVRVGKSPDWLSFTRKHRRIFAMFALAAVLAFAGSVYVFLWFVSYAESSGLVPGTLGLWTMMNLGGFIVKTIALELLLVGVPSLVCAIAGWQWWMRLPPDDTVEHQLGRTSWTSRRVGGLFLLLLITFCIKVYLDGNWNVPIATFTLDYVVGSIIWVLESTLVIVGISLATIVAWRLRSETRKYSEKAV